MHELPGIDGRFPTGLVSAQMPEVNLPEPLAFLRRNFQYAENTKIIRIINAALEQLRPVVERAVSQYGPEKIGVCLGSCDIGSEAVFLAQHVFEDHSLHFQSASFSAEFITRKFGITGPAFTIATACASGANAIVRGAELIRAGYCDAVIAGGADVVTESVFAGFHSLEALSEGLTNPFSKNRKGINLGEGAAFFLLEPEKNSGVELLGAGESADAYHMTAPAMDGVGPANAMKAALLDAGITSDQIGYVNFHGTGTVLNDKSEALAMKAVFGAASVPASSTKPITGHALGAAGALEAAICWMVLTEQRGLPVHCWDGISDEEISFTPIGSSGEEAWRFEETPSICDPAPRPGRVRTKGPQVPLCMSNSFGFGGCNVSLVLGRCD